MYKLILATNRVNIREMFKNINWLSLGFCEPLYAADSDEAIALLNSKAVDAIGFYLEGNDVTVLSHFLHYERPSLPVYSVSHDAQKQLTILRELSGVLNRIHADTTDEPYDDDMMRTMMRDELMHSLLCGELEDFSVAERQFKLIRAHISTTRPCMVYELDMPQGDVYMSQHANAADRLERALRNNFFGGYVDHIYYTVAVITPRHIRAAAIPEGGLDQDFADFERRANEHMQASIDKIKEYLNLDMTVAESGPIRNLRGFLNNEGGEGNGNS